MGSKQLMDTLLDLVERYSCVWPKIHEEFDRRFPSGEWAVEDLRKRYNEMQCEICQEAKLLIGEATMDNNDTPLDPQIAKEKHNAALFLRAQRAAKRKRESQTDA